jgi:carboxylesterase type B
MKLSLLGIVFGTLCLSTTVALPWPSVDTHIQVIERDTSPTTGSTPSATIDSGVIIGAVTNYSKSNVQVNQFLGIPFAQPPIGNLRFSPPQKPNNWTHPLNTNRLPPSCIQDFGNRTSVREFQMTLFDSPPPPNGESEDCLYLNVYVPVNDKECNESKSVLFWIYGGGYDFGSGSLPLYDGTSFAANQDIIVVTFNYRTNCMC